MPRSDAVAREHGGRKAEGAKKPLLEVHGTDHLWYVASAALVGSGVRVGPWTAGHGEGRGARTR